MPPTVFVPQPKVESALVRIDAPTRAGDDADPDRLFALVRGRLRPAPQDAAALAGRPRGRPRRFGAAGVAPEARAEELDVDDWGRLAAWRRRRCRVPRRPS